MESPSHHHGHLDATTGREVVYCHACSNEWYRDESGLICPECEGEITEIISPENDPRNDLEEPHRSSTSTSPEHPYHHRPFNDDSDPDEADIEEHMGPHGFTYQRSVRNGPAGGQPHTPDVHAVMQQFMDMLHQMGPEQRPQGQQPGQFGGSRVTHQTFTSSPFGRGTASVTIFSGPAPTINRGDAGGGPFPGPPGGHGDPFQSIFSNVLRDIGSPASDQPPHQQQGGPPQGFARSLQDILSMFNPAAAVSGDAVYSQEALDRIITNLMEANPQSNAAPPASEEALNKLDRRTVTSELLSQETRAECSVCIEDLKEGEKVVFLPCKHWFHEDCVVLWLKEHNTCPVCRSPIEKDNRGQHAGPSGEGGSSGAGAGEGGGAHDARGTFGQMPGAFHGYGSSPFGYSNDGSGGYQSGNTYSLPGTRAEVRTISYTRPPNHRQGTLNHVIRHVSSLQRQNLHDRSQERATSASEPAYDTSNLQRRTPMSTRQPQFSHDNGYPSRVLHPIPSSQGRRRDMQYQEPRRSSGQGPLSWLRDRFSGGSGNPFRSDERS